MAAPLLSPVPVLLDDGWVLAVDKPAGTSVHPGAGLTHEPLQSQVRRQLGPRAERNGFQVSAAHRLDRDTSGVLLFALRRPAMRALVDSFTRGEVHKRYVALVEGRITEDAGLIDQPLSELDDPSRTKQAVTRFRVLARSDRATLVECLPQTGRTHQIRRHLQSIGHPIAADARYGARDASLSPRLFLHAASVRFPHPRDRSPCEVEAPLPADLAAVLTALGLPAPA